MRERIFRNVEPEPESSKKRKARIIAGATVAATVGIIGGEFYGVERFKKAFPLDTTHAQTLPSDTPSIPKLDLPPGFKLPELPNTEVKQSPLPITTPDETNLEEQQKNFDENVAEIQKLFKNNFFSVTHETTREEYDAIVIEGLGSLDMDRRRPSKVNLSYYPQRWDKSPYLKNFEKMDNRIESIPLDRADEMFKIIRETNKTLDALRIQGIDKGGLQKFEDGKKELTTVGIRLQLESEEAVKTAIERMKVMSQP